MSKLNVCRWIEKTFPEVICPEDRELLGTNVEQVKFFDYAGYVDRSIESVHPNRIAEVVEILTSAMVFGYESYLLNDIFMGICELKGYLVRIEKRQITPDPLARYDYAKLNQIEKESYQMFWNLHHEFENKGMTDSVIVMLCRLSNFIEYLKAGFKNFYNHKNLIVTEETIENIRTMINRSAKFLRDMGANRNRLELRCTSYSKKITGGCLDFNNDTAFFDMKTKNNIELSDRDVRQMIVYKLMAARQHWNFDYAYIFNPRHGSYYKIDLRNIPNKYIVEVLENW